MMQRILNRSINKIDPTVAIVGLLYLLSRVIFFLSGVRFQVSPLYQFWQYIDPYLMRNHLWQSIFYLHIQPPLYNLFIGLFVKYLPESFLEISFSLVHLLLGVSLTISMFLVMAGLGVRKLLAATLTVLFVISPACILYENWLYNTYFVASLLSCAALFLLRFAKNGKFHNGLIFFSILMLVCCTRSTFHIGFLVLIILLIAALQRFDYRRVRTTLLASALPLLIVVLLYTKNYFVFGSFSSSSWLGMNIAQVTYSVLSEQEKNSLIEQNQLSGVALIPPFQPIHNYETFISEFQVTDIPVLDRKWKKGLGKSVNYNNIAYISIEDKYRKDAVYTIRNYPLRYLKSTTERFFKGISSLETVCKQK